MHQVLQQLIIIQEESSLAAARGVLCPAMGAGACFVPALPSWAVSSGRVGSTSVMQQRLCAQSNIMCRKLVELKGKF